jgi:hypothetical protein
MTDIRQWLEQLGLVQYVDAFKANDIDSSLQYAIAGHVYDAPLVRLDALAEYPSVSLECSDRGTVVDLHEARVSGYVGRKNRCEFSATFGVGHRYLVLVCPRIMSPLTPNGYPIVMYRTGDPSVTSGLSSCCSLSYWK